MKIVSFSLTFSPTESAVFMIKCQIDMTKLYWFANTISFSDLIKVIASEIFYFPKKKEDLNVLLSLLFNTDHTHEFFSSVSLEGLH